MTSEYNATMIVAQKIEVTKDNGIKLSEFTYSIRNGMGYAS